MSKVNDVIKMNEFIRVLAETTGDYTMPCQQQLLLLSLYSHHTINQSDLENMTGVKRSSNSRNIAKLGAGEKPWEQAGPGWVESFEDPYDRRLKMVRLTPGGRDLIDSVWKKVFDKKAE